MTDSIESMQRPPLEVVELPTGDLHPDPVNPNRIDDRRMEALKRDIVERGFVLPVVVRPDGKGKWTIIDGEHRWRILEGIGAKKVPCVVDDAPEDDAHLRMLALNRLKGEPNPVKLANLLADLAGEIGEEELQARLGMPEDEYAEVLLLQDAGEDLDARMTEALEREEADAPEVLRWKLGPRQAQQLENAIDSLVDEGKTRADALIQILEGR